MGMVTWVRNVISSILPASLGQGGETFEKKEKPRLFDVTDGYFLVEEARKWGLSMVRKGRTELDEVRDKLRARRFVRKNISEVYDLPEIIDEVTEKIYEASREDHRFRNLFG